MHVHTRSPPPSLPTSPPRFHATAAYDTRLLNLDGKQIFATTNCKACTFMVGKIEIAGTPTEDGGLANLRVWASSRMRAFLPWAQGRNQALFAAPATASSLSPPALMVQPWLSLVASFGVPISKPVHVAQCYREQAQWWGRTSVQAMISRVGMRRAVGLRGTSMCGTIPIGMPLNTSMLDVHEWGRLQQRRVEQPHVRSGRRRRRRRRIALLNDSSSGAITTAVRRHLSTAGVMDEGLINGSTSRAAVADAVTADPARGIGSLPFGHPLRFGDLSLIANHTAFEKSRRTFDVGGHRVSPTANLILVDRASTRLSPGQSAPPPCAALLGVGHTHRGTGSLELRQLRVSAERRLDFSGSMSAHSLERMLRRHGGRGGRGEGMKGRGARAAPRRAGGKRGGKRGGRERALRQASRRDWRGARAGGMGGHGGSSTRESSERRLAEAMPAQPRAANGTAGRNGLAAAAASHPALEPFQFGFGYTHFFYAMEPKPPYRILAISPEFCIGAAQDATDCESVQFISGIVHEAASERNHGHAALLLSFGINDCEAKVARMRMSSVWSMLRPLAGETDVCQHV